MAGKGGRLTEVVADSHDRRRGALASGGGVRLHRPGSQHRLAGRAVDVDQWGFLVTDVGFATSVPGVFAAGDARAGSTKQLGAAVGEGIAALIAIRGYLQAHSDLRRVDVNA